MAVNLEVLLKHLDELLKPEQISDYCPNGLQLEGRPEIRKIVSGVTASQALVDAAIAANADALLVHHGYFWRGEDPCVKGIKKRRLAALIKADISLLAYHLPLDIHPTYGNNVQLAKRLGIEIEGGLEADNPKSVGLYGRLPEPMSATEFNDWITEVLGRTPLHIDGGDKQVQRIGWCTGAAQGYIDQAISLDLDAYISGEVSESTVHTARESGIHYFSAGHHATERYGVQALGEQVSQHFGIEHQFIDIDNPV
ncbi:MAG: Nif3-like dinuclear metal center hexameric protein [Motiliproteus sp.]|nr:Nif3-like dinuclear metal center hexameric protein [Motiliproteus sp.]MCW9051017.1 Nif3-like dinuclear metal center hexameric protein [Motiliproteus sp.]